MKPIGMNVALMTQRSGAQTLERIEDGAVLRDGRGNPVAGDRLKVHFAANCDCYVYVIGIDATGYVAQIFPDPEASLENPVVADKEYLLPEGNQWWGLDDYRGIEQIYFLASHDRRAEVEDILTSLAGQPRKLTAQYTPVTEPALIPVTRGLVKVTVAEPVSVPTAQGAQQVTPTNFLSNASGAGLLISRWFEHQWSSSRLRKTCNG